MSEESSSDDEFFEAELNDEPTITITRAQTDINELLQWSIENNLAVNHIMSLKMIQEIIMTMKIESQKPKKQTMLTDYFN